MADLKMHYRILTKLIISQSTGGFHREIEFNPDYLISYISITQSIIIKDYSRFIVLSQYTDLVTVIGTTSNFHRKFLILKLKYFCFTSIFTCLVYFSMYDTIRLNSSYCSNIMFQLIVL